VGAPWAGGLGHKLAVAAPENFDYFHELIILDEFGRCGSGGVLWGLLEGVHIGLPPVLNFGSKELRERVGTRVLKGEGTICLCITEPYAGSDVANIRCVAKKSACGTYYSVSGEKKWITNGVWADFFTVAVRTGGPGMGGISLLVVEKTMPGVTCKRMDCMGVWASGTTYVTFEDVRVPASNLVGKENEGFKYVMHNFNHERWGFVVQANRFARVCYEEAFKYAHRRRTFGKKLIEHPVIRAKLADMIRQIDATHAQMETITYQMCTMDREESAKALAGITALAKVQSTKVFEYCAREAAQIFGGASYVRGGQGEKVERLYRDVRAYAIPGGSEEIMMDLGVRQAMKEWEKQQSKM
jgi:alkylation response protein AidB-like acyl-CoA dehydrogenase